ncbi:hypothetical protein LTR41_001798 [Exophiala xenobiotica]|nr:hypothetical protein LTR41_001798 [Exophiala xenobiotica]
MLKLHSRSYPAPEESSCLFENFHPSLPHAYKCTLLIAPNSFLSSSNNNQQHKLFMTSTLRRLPHRVLTTTSRINKPTTTPRTFTRNMALFPRFGSAFGPYRHEMQPFFKLFDDTFSELQKISDTAQRSFTPKFDVKEAKDKYVLEGELPGIEQKDVTIEFADESTLTIKGRTEHYREEGQKPSASQQQGQGQQGAEQQQQQQQESSSTEVATTGSKEVGRHDPQHTYWVSERSVGEFARSFAFPTRVDHENVKASLKNGILSVVVPKLQKVNTSKKIEISNE